MTRQEIKEELAHHLGDKAIAEGRIIELRAICEHEETYVGNYSWRVGCVSLENFCTDCGGLIVEGNDGKKMSVTGLI